MKVKSTTEDLIVQATSGQGDRPAGNCPIRFGTEYSDAISGRRNKVVEILTSRKVDLCCLLETRWRGGSTRLVKRKDSIYKLFSSGDQSGLGGTGLMLLKIESTISFLLQNTITVVFSYVS